MKLSKTKKIFLSGTTLAILTGSIVTPIVLLNKDENNDENDVEKLFKILKDKTNKEKVIELPSSASGKIIANNQAKIIAKIKTLVGQTNLKEVKIEILKKDDTNISITPQKIIIKITKNEFSKEIEDFSVKKINSIDKEIESIKKSLDAKSSQDLMITLPSSSTGKIIGNATNKIAIEKELKKLIDPSNTNGNSNHASLRGTSIQVSKSPDAIISTTPQNIIVSISKSGGKTLRTTNTFQVKRAFTPDEEIVAIKTILDSKTREDLIITLPNDSIGKIIENVTNKNEIIKKLRQLIDPSNTNGVPNHASLRGTTIEVSMNVDAPISTTAQDIVVSITKSGGTTLRTTNTFQVKRNFTASEDIKAIKRILDAKSSQDLIITLPSSSTGSIINNKINKNAIERKIRIIIDPSNTNGDVNHPSLRGTIINITEVIYPAGKQYDFISVYPKAIVIMISKNNGTSLNVSGFVVKKSRN